MIKNTDEYNQHTTTETLKTLKVNAHTGLSNTEAAQRIGIYGYNVIEEKRITLASDFSSFLGIHSLDN